MSKLKLALFISGGGTTASAIIKACFSDLLIIDPVLIIANKKDIFGIDRLKQLGFRKIDIVVVNPKTYKYPNNFADNLLDECTKRKVDLIGQYGWLPLTPKKLIKYYKNRIINQHPGPLDTGRADFGGKGMYGRRVHAAVLYFRRMTKHDFWTEATTHFVTEEFDKGYVIKRQQIKINSDDTIESLQEKVLPIEHKVQIEALKDFADGKVKGFKRNTPLIKKTELKILKEAKRIAEIYYPNG